MLCIPTEIKIPTFLNRLGLQDFASLAMSGSFSFLAINYIN
jgi:hypothetical protein